jgi:hypothetical protein
MVEEEREQPDEIVPANDNIAPHDAPPREVVERVDRATMKLARLIGRIMAREDFEARVTAAANDNAKSCDDAADTEA